jgi:ABC-type branched-subunit amino acid transport system permease subunit
MRGGRRDARIIRGEKKKEVKESLTSLKAMIPNQMERHHQEEVVLLLLACLLSSLLGCLLGYFLRRFLLGGH